MSGQLSASTIYVNQTASGNSDGSSWNDAFTQLQDAIDQAAADDEIWVAKGVYYPTKDSTGNDSPVLGRTKTFYINKSVKIYGGFSGTETSRSQRISIINLTILSGDLDLNDDNTDGNHISETSDQLTGDNALHVVYINDVRSNCVLDGFVITGGKADLLGMGWSSEGGGILLRGGYQNTTDPTISNCAIVGNQALYAGGGVSCLADGNGGTVSNVVSPIFERCTFIGNSASTGAALQNEAVNGGSSRPVFKQCLWMGNASSNGAVLVRAIGQQADLRPTFTACAFNTNITLNKGGVFFCEAKNGAECRPEFSNSLLNNNSALEGGIAYINSDDGTMVSTWNNCTFAGNTAGLQGDIFSAQTENSGVQAILLNNSILGGTMTDPIHAGVNVGLDIAHSILEGHNFPTGFTDMGDNLENTDPLFTDMANDDYTLLPCSPGIDAGRMDLSQPVLDLEGRARSVNGQIDLGAYELQGKKLTDIVYLKAFSSTDELGSSWATPMKSFSNAIDMAERCPEVRQIWMTRGTFKPETEFDQTLSFRMINGVSIMGGFKGTEASASERDPVNNKTIISGDIGYEDYLYDNVYHVFRNEDLDQSAVLDGVTIYAGGASGLATTEEGMGGGMLNINSDPVIRNCQFIENIASLGGGVANVGNSNPVFVNCTLDSNEALTGGGAVYCENSDIQLINNVINDNRAPDGGVLAADASSVDLYNCTLVGNVSTNDSGILFGYNGQGPLVRNNIIWNFEGEAISGDHRGITYSLVEGGFTGLGNMDADPKFFDLGTRDLQISVCSPAVDAGDNAGLDLPETDMAGSARIFNNIVDLGAYEVNTFDETVPPVAIATDVSIVLDGNNSGEITAAEVGANSYDNCAIDTMYLDRYVFDCDQSGVNEVVLTVIDVYGNSHTDTARVTVADIEPPTAVIDNFTAQLDENGELFLDAMTLGAASTDNCGIDTLYFDQHYFVCDQAGQSFDLVMTAMDAYGNKSTTTVKMSLFDETGPDIMATGLETSLDSLGRLSVHPDLFQSQVFDNCGVDTIWLDRTEFGCLQLGTNNVRLSARDVHGNLSEQSVELTITDVSAPQIEVRDITLDVPSGSFGVITTEDVVVNTSDNCSVREVLLSQTKFSIGSDNPVAVTATVYDHSDNSTEATFWVTLLRTTSVDEGLGKDARVSVFPNPVENDLTLQLENAANGFTDVFLYSAEGKTLAKRNLKVLGSLHTEQFQLSDLPAGVYWLEIRQQTGVQTIKIVKP